MTEALVPVTALTTPQHDDEQEPQVQPSPEEMEAARELVRQARDRGVSLTGPQGLLKALTKTVIETALDVGVPPLGERWPSMSATTSTPRRAATEATPATAGGPRRS